MMKALSTEMLLGAFSCFVVLYIEAFGYFFLVNRLSFVSFVAAKLWQFSIRNKFFAAFRLKLLRQSRHFATNPQNGWKSCRKPHKKHEKFVCLLKIKYLCMQ